MADENQDAILWTDALEQVAFDHVFGETEFKTPNQVLCSEEFLMFMLRANLPEKYDRDDAGVSRRRPFKCPVCCGQGRDWCDVCGGGGIVWEIDGRPPLPAAAEEETGPRGEGHYTAGDYGPSSPPTGDAER